MYFYHRYSKTICAGRSLALCISADFCHQSQHEDAQPQPVPRNTAQNNGVVIDRNTVTTVSDIFDQVTPVPDQNNPESPDRIQRTPIAGTRSLTNLVDGNLARTNMEGKSLGIQLYGPPIKEEQEQVRYNLPQK